MVSGTTDGVISLNLQAAPNNLEATRLALKTILFIGQVLSLLVIQLQCNLMTNGLLFFFNN
ncbi:hypothetical protein [Rippkaea orientalis]|uniref:hypothetical protein n=1 Tax=Rippkaea orientalis TaxID=2546366 RepID=UPI00031DDFBC|nr:hypothetical protein [Rippkaea orientalis]